MTVATIAFATLFAVYAGLVLALIAGWKKALHQHDITPGLPLRVSVVVPARNERQNLPTLLAHLHQQTHTSFEVVVVDDQSTDNTLDIALKLQQQYLWLKVLRSDGAGKKAALACGIAHSSGDIVITTDADCRVGKRWITTMAACFTNEAIQLAFGPVAMEGGTLFGAMQQMEFATLVGAGAATAAWHMPTMSNGANLAFRRTAFEAVLGYNDNLHIASGDDEFLMRKIAARYPGSITFAGHADATVRTTAHHSLYAFVQQRIRWGGKARHHRTWSSKVLALFVFAFQCSVIVLPWAAVAGWVSGWLAAALWSIKFFLELVFIQRVCTFLAVRWQWRAFVTLQVVYPFYILCVGLLSNFRSFEWKGRRLKSLQVSGS